MLNNNKPTPEIKTPSIQSHKCATCHSDAADFQELLIWTGEFLGSHFNGPSRISHSYGNFKIHNYVICQKCQQKRSKQILWALLAHLAVAFLIMIVFAILSAFQSGAMLVGIFMGCQLGFMVSLILSPISIGVFFILSPVNKLKQLALQERRREKDIGRVMAFSEREYDKLHRS